MPRERPCLQQQFVGFDNAGRGGGQEAAAAPDDPGRRGQAGSVAVITVCSVALPFGKVRPRRDNIDHPAGHRRASRRRVGGRNGGKRREEGFGHIGSGVQGDTLADQTGAQDSRTGDSNPAGGVCIVLRATNRALTRNRIISAQERHSSRIHRD